MRSIYFFCVTFACILGWGLPCAVSAQTPDYYQELYKEPSGINTAPYQAELDSAAKKLCLLFDTLGFVNQFKVFSAGFYVEREFYNDSYPEAFDALKAQAAAASPYYLLIGRESSTAGGV